MLAKYKRNKKTKKKESRFLPFFAGALILMTVVFLGFSNWRISRKRSDLQDQIQDMLAEIQILEERKQELKSQAIQVQEEGFWEKKIREQGYKKPGEEVAVILPPEDKEAGEKERSGSSFERFLEKLIFW